MNGMQAKVVCPLYLKAPAFTQYTPACQLSHYRVDRRGVLGSRKWVWIFLFSCVTWKQWHYHLLKPHVVQRKFSIFTLQMSHISFLQVTHMPPELLSDGRLTKAADVYAFGEHWPYFNVRCTFFQEDWDQDVKRNFFQDRLKRMDVTSLILFVSILYWMYSMESPLSQRMSSCRCVIVVYDDWRICLGGIAKNTSHFQGHYFEIGPTNSQGMPTLLQGNFQTVILIPLLYNHCWMPKLFSLISYSHCHLEIWTRYTQGLLSQDCLLKF